MFLLGAIIIILKGLLVGIGIDDIPDRLGYKIDEPLYYALKSIAFGVVLILIAMRFFPKTSIKK